MLMKSYKTLVSVVVPVYNVSSYLERCVESIVEQSYKNLEIILVDDGSTDDSGKICDHYQRKDRRIKVVHKINGGLSDARNVGIGMATGDFIVLIDSDDWIDYEMIDLSLNEAKRVRVDIVECGFKEIHNDYLTIDYLCDASVKVFSKEKAIEESIKWGKLKPMAWNKLYARKVFDGVCYPKGKLHEDEFTTYKLFYKANKIAFLDLALYNYDRTKEDSITAKYKIQNLDACEAMREKMYFVTEHSNLQFLGDEVCNRYCFTLFDNIAKSVEHGFDKSDTFRGVVDAVINDKEILFRHKIEILYKRCLKDLEKGMIEECIERWKKGVGQL